MASGMGEVASLMPDDPGLVHTSTPYSHKHTVTPMDAHLCMCKHTYPPMYRSPHTVCRYKAAVILYTVQGYSALHVCSNTSEEGGVCKLAYSFSVSVCGVLH